VKQNHPLKSSIILLENVFFHLKKHNRKGFAQVLAEKELSHSAATISRLLKFIEDTFGIVLDFRGENGQVQLVEADENVSRYQFVKSLLLWGRLKHQQEWVSSGLISFTTESRLRNFEYILEVYEAILKSKMLKIKYQKFYLEKEEIRIIKPRLLKEYLGRWYLIGEKNDGEIRVYGIDRITDFEVLNQRFDPDPKFAELYKNTIGVNYSGRVEQVLLKVEPYQLQLFETYPIHPSQEIIEKHKNEGLLALKVVINYEFEQLLASYLDKVSVEAPEYLKQKMLAHFKKMTEKYQK